LVSVPLISIIEDDASLRLALAALIRSLGYQSQDFGSAEDFLRSLDLEQFACIITDIQLPSMSGIELKHHLVAQHHLMPVIMITARAEPEVEAQAIASGASCFLRKPFATDTIIDCIENALKTG
jgi:FixJ family two-component response regulator